MNEWERRLKHIEKEVAQLRDDMHGFRIVPDEDEDTRAGRELYESLLRAFIGQGCAGFAKWNDADPRAKNAYRIIGRQYIKRGEPTEEMVTDAMLAYYKVAQNPFLNGQAVRAALRAVLAPKETTKCTK